MYIYRSIYIYICTLIIIISSNSSSSSSNNSDNNNGIATIKYLNHYMCNNYNLTYMCNMYNSANIICTSKRLIL